MDDHTKGTLTIVGDSQAKVDRLVANSVELGAAAGLNTCSDFNIRRHLIASEQGPNSSIINLEFRLKVVIDLSVISDLELTKCEVSDLQVLLDSNFILISDFVASRDSGLFNV